VTLVPDAYDRLAQRLRAVLPADERSAAEVDRLAHLVAWFATRPLPDDLRSVFPCHEPLRAELGRAVEAALRRPATPGAAERLEERFLELYAHLHGHEAPYSEGERVVVDATGGYWAHAGGLAPILKAPDWITPRSVAVDFGAANGLQGLLMQWLAPHERFIQVEISRTALDVGRRLQYWLGIPPERVEWRAEDVCEAAKRHERYDFVYLYRPVRPDGPGRVFYERLAARLAAGDHAVTIFSIADALHPFLGDAFDMVFGDGHLTCFHRGAR
jgi:hypothetical protein